MPVHYKVPLIRQNQLHMKMLFVGICFPVDMVIKETLSKRFLVRKDCPINHHLRKIVFRKQDK